ncbi:hypothetical protein H2248_009985 [Termitomyces sp. 'cryptogamus']|nr:hypothetical protein H2248_009985 [Termitomyces sp. 'cryptogamus']
MKQLHFSSTTVVCMAIALAASMIAHVLSISLLFPFYNEINFKPTLPLSLQPAALTTVRTSRFGLYANDSDWDTILPAGDGFIYHPQDEQHYLVSHFHQLHCLRSLRRYVRKDMTLTPMDLSHVDHCLIYLRQMILCNADVTLEPANHKQRTPEGKVTNAVTGLGVTHECKDWEQLWGYMEENYQQYSHTYEEST